MPISVRDGGTWKTATPSVRDGGVWKEVQEGWVQDGGIWKLFFQNITFSPDGGTDAGSAVALERIGSLNTSVTISCSQSATWSYTKSGIHGSADVVSGTSSPSITFSLSTTGSNRFAFFTVSATAGSVTRYWTVSLEVGIQ